MIREGILTEDDPVELLDGYLVTKMPRNPPHRLTTQLTREALTRLCPAGWFVDAQEPITTDTSEPEPDVAVIRGDRRAFTDRHPGPGDLALVVEVADTSLSRDRGSKKRLYARAALPVYWIVNLIDRQIEVYTDPTGPAEEPDYRQRQVFETGAELPVEIAGREVGRVSVADLLP